MKILILPSSYPTSYDRIRGSFYREQTLALASRGAEVRVLSVVPHSLKDFFRHRRLLLGLEQYDDGLVPTVIWNVLNIPRLKRLNYLLRGWVGLHIWGKHFSDWRPDIIHAHSVAGGDLARRISFRDRIPYVITEHSSKFFSTPRGIDRNISKSVFGNASKRWAVSPALAERLCEYFDAEFAVLPDSIDTELFKLREGGREFKSTFFFLSVGYLVPLKRTAEIVQAFHRAREIASVPMRLCIVGDGPERCRIKGLIGDLGEEENVEMLGMLSRDRVAEVMRNSDCLVVASSKETFGVVVIEALSCGVPVLSTRCGGPEYILAGAPYCGFVEDVEDSLVEMMVEFADRIIVDREAIREFAVEKYSSKKLANKYLEEFELVLSNTSLRL